MHLLKKKQLVIWMSEKDNNLLSMALDCSWLCSRFRNEIEHPVRISVLVSLKANSKT